MLAQLVEQRTFNPLVVGSNPARPTTYFAVNLFQIKGLTSVRPFHSSAVLRKIPAAQNGIFQEISLKIL